MSLMLGRFQFDGPYATAEMLPSSAGVFAILYREADGVYRIDIDHGGDMRTAVRDRSQHDLSQPTTVWSVTVLPHSADADERQTVVNELRAEYEEDCESETVAA